MQPGRPMPKRAYVHVVDYVEEGDGARDGSKQHVANSVAENDCQTPEHKRDNLPNLRI